MRKWGLPGRFALLTQIDKNLQYVTNFFKIKVYSIDFTNLFFYEVYDMILSERWCFLYAKNNATKT